MRVRLSPVLACTVPLWIGIGGWVYYQYPDWGKWAVRGIGEWTWWGLKNAYGIVPLSSLINWLFSHFLFRFALKNIEGEQIDYMHQNYYLRYLLSDKYIVHPNYRDHRPFVPMPSTPMEAAKFHSEHFTLFSKIMIGLYIALGLSGLIWILWGYYPWAVCRFPLTLSLAMVVNLLFKEIVNTLLVNCQEIPSHAQQRRGYGQPHPPVPGDYSRWSRPSIRKRAALSLVFLLLTLLLCNLSGIIIYYLWTITVGWA